MALHSAPLRRDIVSPSFSAGNSYSTRARTTPYAADSRFLSPRDQTLRMLPNSRQRSMIGSSELAQIQLPMARADSTFRVAVKKNRLIYFRCPVPLSSPPSIYFPPKQATLFQRAVLRTANGAQPVPAQLDLSCKGIPARRQLEFGCNASVCRPGDSARTTN